MTGRRWTYRQDRDRSVFVVTWAGIDALRITWGTPTVHPHRTMIRIVEGLNVGRPVSPRTWSMVWTDPTAGGALCHNGVEMADVVWLQSPVRSPEMWMSRLIDGLNRPGGHLDPVPEPAPPSRLRRVV